MRETKQKRVDAVTDALLGFHSGCRVRIVDANTSALSEFWNGKIVTLDSKAGVKAKGVMAWYFVSPTTGAPMLWCYEHCMKPVLDDAGE